MKSMERNKDPCIGEGVPEDIKRHLAGTGSAYEDYVVKRRKIVVDLGKRQAGKGCTNDGTKCCEYLINSGKVTMRVCGKARMTEDGYCNAHAKIVQQRMLVARKHVGGGAKD